MIYQTKEEMVAALKNVDQSKLVPYDDPKRGLLGFAITDDGAITDDSYCGDNDKTTFLYPIFGTVLAPEERDVTAEEMYFITKQAQKNPYSYCCDDPMRLKLGILTYNPIIKESILQLCHVKYVRSLPEEQRNEIMQIRDGMRAKMKEQPIVS